VSERFSISGTLTERVESIMYWGVGKFKGGGEETEGQVKATVM